MIFARIESKILWFFKKKKMHHIGCKIKVGANFRLKGEKYISIGDCFRAGNNLVIEAWDTYRGQVVSAKKPEIVIGDNVSMMSNCQLSAAERIEIGSGCLFGDNVFITDNLHGCGNEANVPPLERLLYLKGPVKIGNNVWIGRNVCIMPNVVVGDNVVIGANAVVTKNIANDMCVAGVPARVIKQNKIESN